MSQWGNGFGYLNCILQGNERNDFINKYKKGHSFRWKRNHRRKISESLISFGGRACIGS